MGKLTCRLSLAVLVAVSAPTMLNAKTVEVSTTKTSLLPFEGLTFSGKYLMNNGLDIPLKHNVDKDKQTDYSSRILYLEAK